jgi:hypothetical protein
LSFVFSLWDIGLLSAGCAIIVLIVSEVISPHYGKMNILLDLRKLRLAAAIFVVAFLAIGIVNIFRLLSR